MGTNNLTTKSSGEVVNATDPNQYKEALTVDIVPRSSAGVPTDEAGDLGSATYGWGNLYLGNMTLQPDGLTDGSVSGGSITMSGGRKLFINDTTVADHTIGSFTVSGVGMYAIIFDVSITGPTGDLSNNAIWNVNISGLSNLYRLNGEDLQSGDAIITTSTFSSSLKSASGYFILPAVGSETITLTADYTTTGSGSITAVDCNIYVKELI